MQNNYVLLLIPCIWYLSAIKGGPYIDVPKGQTILVICQIKKKSYQIDNLVRVFIVSKFLEVSLHSNSKRRVHYLDS